MFINNFDPIALHFFSLEIRWYSLSYIFGIIFALAAGVFFGIIGPVTKTAYNLGAGVGLAIFLRYIVALLIVSPLIPRQQNLISTYKKNFGYFFLITIASIMLTTGLLTSVTYIYNKRKNKKYY